ncbi:hypothetical protein COO60DRAFT_627822 [Scenedesmus sp. NREL 46B-D3]|nr:hypothetical protein COO60DRAFT_627822 [Scenedesmus sp. NREL 46B-D3]
MCGVLRYAAMCVACSLFARQATALLQMRLCYWSIRRAGVCGGASTVDVEFAIFCSAILLQRPARGRCLVSIVSLLHACMTNAWRLDMMAFHSCTLYTHLHCYLTVCWSQHLGTAVATLTDVGDQTFFVSG